MSRERESSEGSQRKGLPHLPKLPVDVWVYILHKKLHKELCEHLQNENNRRALFSFARQMKVPQAVLQGWNQLSKSEICEKLAKLLSVGAFYSDQGVYFLLRRERAQKGLGVGQQFLDTLNELGISAEGKSIAELLEELKRVEINPSL